MDHSQFQRTVNALCMDDDIMFRRFIEVCSKKLSLDNRSDIDAFLVLIDTIKRDQDECKLLKIKIIKSIFKPIKTTQEISDCIEELLAI